MTYPRIAVVTALALFAGIPALWAGGLWIDGLLEHDAKRLERAREQHSTEIDRAFETYATRVERADSTLSRIYEPIIERYARRGETATAEQLKQELQDLLDSSLRKPFPDDDATDDAPPADSHRQLISAIGPQLVNASDQRAPTARIAEYDYIVLYFTAGWCGYCPPFTAELIEFYNTHRSSGNWEVVVVSGDRNEQAFYDYLRSANMPWAAVPFDRIAQSNLMQTHPGGFPRVVVLDRQGNKAVTASNRAAVLAQFRELLQQ